MAADAILTTAVAILLLAHISGRLLLDALNYYAIEEEE